MNGALQMGMQKMPSPSTIMILIIFLKLIGI